MFLSLIQIDTLLQLTILNVFFKFQDICNYELKNTQTINNVTNNIASQGLTKGKHINYVKLSSNENIFGKENVLFSLFSILNSTIRH